MAEKVLIVDDDDISGDLSRQLLEDAGFEAELLTESRLAFERVKRARPALVILDILMPGIDGLSLCRQIKSDPETRKTKVIMVSAKTFAADRRKALSYGADLYITKPYDIETFALQIKQAAGLDPAPMARPALSDAPNAAFKVSVWGCRSASSGGGPAPDPSRYGRATPCVAVEIEGRLIVFDAGTGLPEGWRKNGAAFRDQREVWIFLSHFHPAHVSGLSEFPALSEADRAVHFCGAREADQSLEELVRKNLEGPGRKARIKAKLDLYEITEERYEIFPGVWLDSFYANHPGTTLGFSLESRGRKLVYCPDDELYGEAATALQDHDERTARFASGADLLIHDGRYTQQDFRGAKNSGHSCFLDAVDLAGKSRAKRLMIFHHDDRYTDAELDRIGVLAGERARQKGYALEAALAQDGLIVSL